MKTFRIILSFFLLFTTWSANITAQQKQEQYSTTNNKAIKAFESARKLFDIKKDDEATEQLQKAIKADPAFIEAHLFLAEIYAEHRQYPKAIEAGNRAIEINPGFFKSIYYSMGFWNFRIMEYDKAAEHLRIYLNQKGIPEEARQNAQLTLKSAEFASRAVKFPVPFQPENLGPNVNSANNDYLATLTVDEQTLIFTRLLQEGHSKSEDFFVSKKVNGQWEKSKNMGPPVNTSGNEGAECISADGKTLVFTACEERTGYTGGRQGFGSCDLFISRMMSNGQWTEPRNMGKPVNSEAWESQPALSADGKILYFVSNRKGGKGGADIYKSSLKADGKWSAPQNLGDSVNTPLTEESPFLHPDNQTFYFSSEGWPGMGRKDIFISRIKPDGKFSTPQNVGYPVNTAEDDWGLIVSASGKKAIYSTEREGGSGGMDLYSFDLPEKARATPVTFVKGVVRNISDKQGLSAEMELIDLFSGEVAMHISSSEDGQYLICLPAEKNYALNVSRNGFMFHSENFSLKNLSSLKPFELNVDLTPIKAGNKVVLKNIFFETGKFELRNESRVELEKLIQFMQHNAGVNIEVSGHTDNVGDKKQNQLLSENRAKSVITYLVEKGIPASRLSAAGYGDQKPIAGNDTEEGRATNRRTEFMIKSSQP